MMHNFGKTTTTTTQQSTTTTMPIALNSDLAEEQIDNHTIYQPSSKRLSI
jgi:hypothetical protein